MGRAAAVVLATVVLLAGPGCLMGRVAGLGVTDEPARSTLASSTIALARQNALWLARGDGNDARLLVSATQIGHGGAIFLPMAAPGGRRLLFLSVVDLDVRESRGRDLSLNIVDLDGDDPARASISGWRQVRLEKIAPAASDGLQDIFMVGAAGWSRDGSRIALGLNRPASMGGDAILLLDAMGEPTILYDLVGRDLSRLSSISWTPDGGSLLFGAESATGDGDTIGVVLRLDLPGPEALSRSAVVVELGPGRYPALSPDGSRIAVVDDRAGQWDLLLLDPRGREIDRFVRPAGRGLSRPQWSADGRYLYYYSLASTGPLGLIEISMLRCLDTLSRRVFDLMRLG